MLIHTVLFLTCLAAAFANHGLTAEERAQFKPLNVNKVEINNTGKKGLVNITDPGSSKTYFEIFTNSVPSHSTVKWPRKNSTTSPKMGEKMGDKMEEGSMKNDSMMMMGLSPLLEIPRSWRIPKVPRLRSHPIMCVGSGAVGLSTGGVMIFGAYVPRRNCPFQIDEIKDFDDCRGHTTPTGHYHYHGHSSCNRMEVCGEPSKIFGVALDGIPIYGPFDENGKQMTQSDLDICGGRTGVDGRYRYHITADAPFLLNCFRGDIHKELLNTLNPDRDHFQCQCPFDDSLFPECHQDAFCTDDDSKYTAEERAAAQKDFRDNRMKTPKPANICNWNVTTGDYADCNDMINATYTPSFTQIRKKGSANLIGCCPKGETCGESCHNNTKCYVERREGMFMVREILKKNSAHAVQATFVLYCVMVLGLFMR